MKNDLHFSVREYFEFQSQHMGIWSMESRMRVTVGGWVQSWAEARLRGTLVLDGLL